MQPAMFLDRDGVIIKDIGYLARLEAIELIPGAADAIRSLNHAQIAVIVVTNQSGVAKGLFPETFVSEAHNNLAKQLAEHGATIDGWYHCPHYPMKGIAPYRIECDCRKPKPGMLRRAAGEHQLDLTRSWLIGDKLTDCAAGAAVGCRTILVRSGHGNEQDVPADASAYNLEAVVPALPEAVELFFQRRAAMRAA